MTVVARYTSLGEAAAAQSALDAAGIDVTIADEEIVALNWLYSNAVGGVKVVVPDEDAESAAAVLSAPEVAITEDTDTPQEEVIEPQQLAVCPDCQSAEFTPIPRLWLFLFFSLFFFGVGYGLRRSDIALAGIAIAALVFALSPKRRCVQCGTRWDPPAPDFKAPLPNPTDTIAERCARCGSTEVHPIRYRRLKAVPLLFELAILIVLPIWILLPKRHCENCGLKRWLPSV